MSYACIHVYMLCLFCCLGLLASFGPLWSYTWVYVCCGVGVYMVWVVEGKEKMVCRWSWVLDELRFGSRRFIRPPNLLHGGLAATACFACSALFEGFGRRRCRRRCLSFVSGEDIRPPNLPPKVSCPAFFCMLCMDSWVSLRGFLGKFKRVISTLVWSLIWVHLYRYRPEEPERAAVSTAPEVQSLQSQSVQIARGEWN